MDSPQSVVSPYKTAEQEKQKTDEHSETNGKLDENFIGVLEVYVHQARDIHNICIYHKQDVYAKISLTSDPEHTTVSTNTINGGGRNPVFNENLRINMSTLDCSLKCEIFMMSRVKNYLEDQLLGFALVPLSQVFMMKNWKLEKKEFSLSSTDMFHSPAGYVQLSLCYNGAPPEVMPIPALPATVGIMELSQESFQGELDKLEFPDPNIANENQMMVSEYFEFPSSDLESQTSESLVNSARVSCSSNGVSSEISKAPKASETVFGEENSVCKDKETVDDGANGENYSSSREEVTKRVIEVDIEPQKKGFEQDIVEMYMKSMQQFTESLAKMKLPLDIDNSGGPRSSASSTSSEQKTPSSANKASSRVFYGSRAFF